VRAVVQRVAESSVTIEGAEVSRIGPGLLVLLGVAEGDTTDDARFLARKIVDLRIFQDQAGKMNLSVRDLGREVMVVSQFTLLADCRKGRRPSFVGAAPPEQAQALYQVFVQEVGERNVAVVSGRFREHMRVSLVNDGPVTIILDSDRAF